MIRHDIKTSDDGVRADVFLASKMPKFSRSWLSRLFKSGHVRANSKVIKAGHKLSPGEVIEVDHSLLNLEPEPFQMPIIYEDSRIIVLNKPPGILTHSKGAVSLEPTVASFIKGKIADDRLSGNRAGIVHRLDRLTSGVMIAAKDAGSMLHMQRQFAAHKVKKCYLALVEGELKPKQAIVDVPIGRDPRQPYKFRPSQSGKRASTHYRVLRYIGKGKNAYSLVELMPQTGRTHQLRVHMSYLSHPIVGDRIYGSEDEGPMFLHALSLELNIPGGERKSFMADPPDYFRQKAGI